MASLYQIETLPTTSQAAIREFEDRYIAGAGAQEPNDWAATYGDFISTPAPMLTFPISALGLKYQETKQESRYKTMAEESFDVKTVEFDDGIQAKLLDLFQNAFAYRKWQTGPSRLLIAETTHRIRQIATLLEAGAATTCWDGKGFFDTDHPCNFADASKGTYSNYQASTKSVVSLANIEAECTLFMQNAKDEQGEVVESSPDTIIVPTATFMALSNLLGQALVPSAAGTATMNNPFYGGKFTVVHAPQLTDANDWYLLDSKRISQAVLPPWITLKQNVPATLALRQYDESSDFFKDTGHIKMSSHIWYGFALAFPHCIRLIKGA